MVQRVQYSPPRMRLNRYVDALYCIYTEQGEDPRLQAREDVKLFPELENPTHIFLSSVSNDV
jgi:hypothetical protein